MKNRLEIIFWEFAIYLIRQGYGANCEISDLKDFPDMYTKPEHVFCEGRCPSCRAKEIVEWLEDHIRLIRN